MSVASQLRRRRDRSDCVFHRSRSRRWVQVRRRLIMQLPDCLVYLFASAGALASAALERASSWTMSSLASWSAAPRPPWNVTLLDAWRFAARVTSRPPLSQPSSIRRESPDDVIDEAIQREILGRLSQRRQGRRVKSRLPHSKSTIRSSINCWPKVKIGRETADEMSGRLKLNHLLTNGERVGILKEAPEVAGWNITHFHCI